MAFQNVIYERKEAIAYITLNRPEKLNAMNGPTLGDLQTAFDVAGADPDVRVVIITGAGRAFSAGLDITPDPDAPHPHKDSVEGWRDHLQELINTFMKVWHLPKPVVAAVNGYALGGACEMVQVCDVKIASERAVLGEPEIRAGFGPPLLITPYSVNLANAKELLLTGDTVDAYEAARIGLVNRVVPHDSLMEECERVARKMCLMSQLGMKMTKVSVNRALENMGFLNSISQNLELMTIFDTSTSPEQDEFNAVADANGLRAALDWRDGRFRDLD